jgi:hypothetical protein
MQTSAPGSPVPTARLFSRRGYVAVRFGFFGGCADGTAAATTMPQFGEYGDTDGLGA